MKSNKQRRAEIKAQRLARAERTTVRLNAADPRRMTAAALRAQGAEPADTERLARLNTTYFLPTFYVDRPFRCRDCGAEEVWTAKQQKWWYEGVGARLESQATRCLPCRRARRAELAKAQSVPGANLLRDEVRWLRAVPPGKPDAATEARVEAALASKWDGVRKVAIEVLGRWQRGADKQRLREWAQDDGHAWYSSVRTAASQALLSLLRHPDDDAWVLQAYASAQYVSWPWGPFVRDMDERVLDSFLHQALQQGNARQASNLAAMLLHAQRRPGEAVWQRLVNHPSPDVQVLAQHLSRMVQVLDT